MGLIITSAVLLRAAKIPNGTPKSTQSVLKQPRWLFVWIHPNSPLPKSAVIKTANSANPAPFQSFLLKALLPALA
jgi:hypothetical protein